MSNFASFIFRRNAEGDASVVVGEGAQTGAPSGAASADVEGPGAESLVAEGSVAESSVAESSVAETTTVESPMEEAETAAAEPLLRLEGKQQKIAVEKGVESTVVVGAKLSARELEDDENESSRKPLDLVVVLDTSGSMSGSKLKMCKETCKFLLSELRVEDRFALVEFNSTVQTVLPLSNTDDLFKQAAHQAIDAVHATGSTNLSGGLFKGISMVTRNEEKRRRPQDLHDDVDQGSLPRRKRKAPRKQASGSWNPLSMMSSAANAAAASLTTTASYDGSADRVRSVLLLTDGQANHGVVDAQRLSQITTDILSGTSISLFTFGYGEGHNADLLRALAESGRGNYYYVENTDQVRDAFADCLGGLLTVVAQNVNLRIEPLGPYTVARVLSRRKHHEKDDEIAGGVTFEIGDLYAGESLYVLVELKCPASLEGLENEPLATMNAELLNIRSEAASMEELSCTLAISRPDELSDEQREFLDHDIAAHIVREETVSALEEATRLADDGNYGVASERLRQVHIQSIETRKIISETGGGGAEAGEQLAMLDNLAADLDVQSTAFKSASTYSGARYRASNMMMNHAVQRGWSPDNEGYQKKGKARMKERSKAYFSAI